MASPTRSPVSEESNTNSAPEKSSPKALPSLSQSLVDLTKKLLNWPQFGIDLNFAVKENSSKKEETEQEIESPEYSLAKAQWTPKWPENFNDLEMSQDTEKGVQNDTVIENDQNNTDPIGQKGAHQGDADRNDQKDTNQTDVKRISKVSFATTDSEKTDDMDTEAENESSEGQQTGLFVLDEENEPTLILKIPPWTDGNGDPEGLFDNLLYEIPSFTDSDTNVEEVVVDTKKWLVEPGNNRNYIKTLINGFPRSVKRKEGFERTEKSRRFKWIINYDNMNYIRSLLSPEIFEKILKEDELKRNETSHRYRDMFVN